ncbi:MAG: thiazole biosynthesis adenylyltransferase ThiF [Firmicutes bacterium]|nr:thiazole biosynthesis adenylyltransferase ThiF [Bacillota bacterium]
MGYENSRYSRQVLVSGIGEEGQEFMSRATAVVIGLGALGSTSANVLARAGVGTIRLVDRDFVDWTNLQRQGLYDEDDARNSIPKAVAAREHLVRFNSEISYEVVVDDVNPGNVERIVAGATVVVDGLDNFYTRALINEACVKAGIPWVHGACVSTYGTVSTCLPGETACYNCLYPNAAGLSSPFTCDTAGVLGPVTFTIASWEASEALKIAAGRKDRALNGLMLFDLWDNRVTHVATSRNTGCTVCAGREFTLLRQADHMATASLCGRNAVQVVPRETRRFDYESTARTLSRAFRVESNDYLLRFRVGEYEVALFRDGRAIVFGTTDPVAAKSLYTRYIGG